MTYREIAEKVACGTCGAPRGKFCGVGAGRLRAEPHPLRRLAARGNAARSVMKFLGMGKS